MEELEKKKKELLQMAGELGELEKIWKDKITVEQTMRKQELKMDIKAVKKEITKLSNQATVSSVPKEVLEKAAAKYELLNNPIEWLRNYATSNNVDLCRQGILYNGAPLKHTEYHAEVVLALDQETKIYNDVAKQYKLSKASPVSPTLLMAAEVKWYREITSAKRAELNRMIKYDPQATDQTLRDWLKLMTGKVDEMHVAVFKHWIQCVKRKLLGLPVEHHIFPILVGSQGAGKSQCLSKLVEPLDGYVLELDVIQVLDKTIAGSFESNAVVVLDELSRGDKASMEELKRMITGKYVDARPPYGRLLEKMGQNCMFIGSSNRNVREVFKDDEMRRFAEIRAVRRSRETYPILDAMDMLSAWKCVDENAKSSYYYSKVDEIEKHQKGLATLPYIQQWSEEIKLKPGSALRSLDTLYNSWSLWLDTNNARYGATSKQGMGIMLANLDIKKRVVNEQTLYLVDDSITVVEPGDAAYVLDSKSNPII